MANNTYAYSQVGDKFIEACKPQLDEVFESLQRIAEASMAPILGWSKDL